MKAIRGGGAPEALLVVRGCAVARLHECVIVRKRLLDYSVWIMIIAMYMLVSNGASQEVFSTCKPFGNCLVM